MVSVVIFTSIGFLPSLTHTSLSHTHCSVKPSLRRQAFTVSEPPTPTHHDRDLAGHRNCADRRRSRSRLRRSASIAISRLTLRAIAIASIGVDCDHRNQRDCDRDLADLARSVNRRFARSRSRSRRSRSRRSRSRRSRSLRSRSRSHREHNLSFWVFSPRN